MEQEKELKDKKVLEILNWLNQAYESEEECEEECEVDFNFLEAVLDLIHRLQSENRELKESCDGFDKLNIELCETIVKQKEPIERLTKTKIESAKSAVEVIEENLELQKKVDELSHENDELEYRAEQLEKQLTKAVKETAEKFAEKIKKFINKNKVQTEYFGIKCCIKCCIDEETIDNLCYEFTERKE